MSLLTTIAVGLGASISKGVLERWFGETTAGGTIVDIVAKKTGDTLAERAARRRFEEIGERIAESLAEHIEAEFPSIDELQRENACRVADEILTSSPLTATLVVKHDLSPDNLRDHYDLEFKKHTRLLDSEVTQLVERLIGEACQYIVDIASQLPSFTEKSFAEVLRRESEIMDAATKILEEVRHLRQQQDPTSRSAWFEHQYRRTILRKLDVLQLLGADTIAQTSRRYNLSVAYVTLTLRANEGSAENKGGDDEDAEPEGKKIEADRIFEQGKRVFVRGDAGSGKTTLLQWLAVQCAGATWDERNQGANELVPFFLRLREFPDNAPPEPEDFCSSIASAISGVMPEGWVHDQLIGGNAVVLVDGLDEVAEERREEIREWLDGLVKTYPDARFVITSRPTAASEGWLDDQAFEEVTLQPMTMGDISGFVQHWHAAVAEALTDAEERETLLAYAVSMLDVVRSQSAIRKLAASPLLCAMLCALHRESLEDLPKNRVRLYQKCCEMLVSRENRKRTSQPEHPQLNDEQKEALLDELAYWMVSGNLSEAEEQDVDQVLDSRRARIKGIPDAANGTTIRRYFVERLALLRSPREGRIDFAHKTFQEFMAARAALNQQNIPTIVAGAHEQRWREVATLAAGLARPAEATSLVEQLIERGDADAEHAHTLHLLAATCGDAALELKEGVRARIEYRIARILPPSNMGEAKAIATTGDVAVPYLTYRSSLTARQAAASLRALDLIDTPEATQAMAGYASDSRASVAREIYRIVEERDPITWPPGFPERTYLINYRRTGLTSLEGLERLRGVEHLELIGCKSVDSFRVLARARGLTGLVLEDCTGLNSLEGLPELPKVKHLDLSGCTDLTSLEGLSSLPSLRSLDLSGCTSLTSLDGLPELAELVFLYLDGCTGLTSLDRMAGLPRLGLLTIAGCTGLPSSVYDLPWKCTIIGPGRRKLSTRQDEPR